MKVFVVYAQNERGMWRKAVIWQENYVESEAHEEKSEYDLRFFVVYAQRQLWWCQKCGICGEDERSGSLLWLAGDERVKNVGAKKCFGSFESSLKTLEMFCKDCRIVA